MLEELPSRARLEAALVRRRPYGRAGPVFSPASSEILHLSLRAGTKLDDGAIPLVVEVLEENTAVLELVCSSRPVATSTQYLGYLPLVYACDMKNWSTTLLNLYYHCDTIPLVYCIYFVRELAFILPGSSPLY